jgi:hypothetical protein
MERDSRQEKAGDAAEGIPRYIICFPKQMNVKRNVMNMPVRQLSANEVMSRLFPEGDVPFFTSRQRKKCMNAIEQRLPIKQPIDDITLDVLHVEGDQYQVFYKGEVYPAILKPLPTVVEAYKLTKDHSHRATHDGFVTHGLYVQCKGGPQVDRETVDGLSPGLRDFESMFAPPANEPVPASQMEEARRRMFQIIERIESLTVEKTKAHVTFAYDDEIDSEPWMKQCVHTISLVRGADKFRKSTMDAANPFIAQTKETQKSLAEKAPKSDDVFAEVKLEIQDMEAFADREDAAIAKIQNEDEKFMKSIEAEKLRMQITALKRIYESM